jgi:3-oxocholest-4-en-26-oyl-CoA dehydrogenase beta subunit
MDFALSDEQQVVADLAEQIFAGQASVDRLKEAERGTGWDLRLWGELAAANIVGLCLPESAGGSGLGPVELLLLCEAQGRHVAPVPLLQTAVAGAALAEFGVPGAHDALLAAAVAGEAVLTTALGSGGANDPLVPGVEATATDGGWRLVGTKPAVPYGADAAAVVVPARTASGGSVVAVVPAGADGVRYERERTTSHQSAATLHLDTEVPASAVLGTPGDESAEVTRWLFDHTVVATCGLQVGVAEGALAPTSSHVSERQQFGRPLSAFQAVTQRAADAWITTEAVRVTAYNAAWRLAAGLDARRDVAVAAFWASEGAQQVVTATQHLHGGIGADVDYPVHRYFLWGTHHAAVLGSASSHLARLGRLLAQS